MANINNEHIPTEDQKETVKKFASVGLKQSLIAGYLGIDEKTLRKHYRELLDKGTQEAHFVLANSLYHRALKGDTAAAIWYSKAQMGWRGEHVEHSSDSENPLVVVLPAKNEED